MKLDRFSKIRTVFRWIGRYWTFLVIAGFYITIIAILMSHGENFFKAVQDSFIFISWFMGQTQQAHNSDPINIAIGFVGLIVFVYLACLAIWYRLKK